MLIGRLSFGIAEEKDATNGKALDILTLTTELLYSPPVKLVLLVLVLCVPFPDLRRVVYLWFYYFLTIVILGIKTFLKRKIP